MRKKKPKRKPADKHAEFMPYSSGQRLIYRYWNGAKKVAADPLSLLRKMESDGATLDIDLKIADSGTPHSGEAFDRIIKSVRKAFDVTEFSETESGQQVGLTDRECIELLLHFGNFMGSLKESALPFVTTPPSTAPPAASNIPYLSGSTSSGTGPSCVAASQ